MNQQLFAFLTKQQLHDVYRTLLLPYKTVHSLNNPRKRMTLHQGLSFIFLVYEFIYKHSKLPFMKYTKESVSELSHAMGV